MEDIRKTNNRIAYFDAAKGIGVISVIVGHLGIGPVNKVIYSFHMPLFFFIAGYFFSNKYSPRIYLKNKAKELLVPYYITCIIICVLSGIIDALRGCSSIEIFDTIKTWISASLYASGSVDTFGIRHIGAIWFLWALFIALCIFKFLVDKKCLLLTVFCFTVVGLVSSKYIWLPLSIQSAFVAIIFLYCGYIVARRNILESNSKAFYVFCLVFWVVSIFFGETNIASNTYNCFLVSLLGGVSSSIVIICILRRLYNLAPNHFILSGIATLGRNSLAILCIHIVEQNLFPWAIFRSYLKEVGFSSFIVILLCLAVKLGWAIGWMILFGRFRITRKIFGMK